MDYVYYINNCEKNCGYCFLDKSKISNPYVTLATSLKYKKESKLNIQGTFWKIDPTIVFDVLYAYKYMYEKIHTQINPEDLLIGSTIPLIKQFNIIVSLSINLPLNNKQEILALNILKQENIKFWVFLNLTKYTFLSKQDFLQNFNFIYNMYTRNIKIMLIIDKNYTLTQQQQLDLAQLYKEIPQITNAIKLQDCTYQPICAVIGVFNDKLVGCLANLTSNIPKKILHPDCIFCHAVSYCFGGCPIVNKQKGFKKNPYCTFIKEVYK